jgi:Ca-activated chloride channel family protein
LCSCHSLKEKNIKLKPFVIGLGLDTSYLSQFECVGEFLSAENEDAFKSVLKFVISQALNNTTVQINLIILITFLKKQMLP